MNNFLPNTYGPYVVIALDYIVTAYWQAKLFEELKDALVARLDTLPAKLDAP